MNRGQSSAIKSQKDAKFRITFQLSVYLQKITALSILSQGTYYISVMLCPKNTIISSSSLSENLSAKAQVTHIFSIKYTSMPDYI